MSTAKFIYFLHEPVEKISIVTNTNDCAVEVFECFFENVLGLHIKVIGRLVKYKEIARLQ